MATTDDAIPLIVFSSVVQNDEPKFHYWSLFLTEIISVFLTVLKKYCTGVFLG